MAKATAYLLPLPSLKTIRRRLEIVFPAGTPNRANAAGDRAARTAFVMLYVGAVAGTDRWIRPDQVTRMSDAQARKRDPQQRLAWQIASLRKLSGGIPGRWYNVNSREGIRDDTLRYAWQPLGAAVERTGLATTSASPRWAMEAKLAAILTWGILNNGEPATLEQMEGSEQFSQMIEQWQDEHLTREARARVQILRRTRGVAGAVPVTLPDGGIRSLAPGDSSLIAKAVIEQFATRFLSQPAVIWLSESREHVAVRDEELARNIGLNISDSRILPDIVLADTNPERLLLVFCEVVATDGPMNERRKTDILGLVQQAGFDTANVAFMTAFLDRDSAPYRKLSSTLAWGSLSWTAAEPQKLTLHVDVARSGLMLVDALDLMHLPRRSRQ